MGRRRSMGTKVKARKKVNVTLLERSHGGKATTAYRLMDEIIEAHHEHLKEAKIAIAWRFGWKANADGRITLGQAKKGSDLDRALHDHDFVILLNHEVWNQTSFTEAQMRALLDHELCHCAVAIDTSGDPKLDENGRTCYRIRKHDIEEFRDVVSRHGVWKEDIESFVNAAMEAKKRPLLNKDAPNGQKFSEPAFGSNGSANGHSNGHVPLPGQKELPIVKDTLPPAIKKRMTSTPAKAAAKKTAKTKVGAKKKK